MSQLIQVRTNTSFSVNYENSLLVPEIELIILVSNPIYTVNEKKGQVNKTLSVGEFRVKTDFEGISNLIGQLQATQGGLAKYQNMSNALNTIIQHQKEVDIQHQKESKPHS